MTPKRRLNKAEQKRINIAKREPLKKNHSLYEAEISFNPNTGICEITGFTWIVTSVTSKKIHFTRAIAGLTRIEDKDGDDLDPGYVWADSISSKHRRSIKTNEQPEKVKLYLSRKEAELALLKPLEQAHKSLGAKLSRLKKTHRRQGKSPIRKVKR